MDDIAVVLVRRKLLELPRDWAKNGRSCIGEYKKNKIMEMGKMFWA